ncbi:MAG: glycosyltransferase family 2 protein, partial [Solirubrobacteraceae bacterium]
MAQPAVTVVIPTRDRSALLAQTLRTVAAQEPPPRIVVVDDGSTDGTAAVLAAFDVTVVRNPAGGWGP